MVDDGAPPLSGVIPPCSRTKTEAYKLAIQIANTANTESIRTLPFQREIAARAIFMIKCWKLFRRNFNNATVISRRSCIKCCVGCLFIFANGKAYLEFYVCTYCNSTTIGATINNKKRKNYIYTNLFVMLNYLLARVLYEMCVFAYKQVSIQIIISYSSINYNLIIRMHLMEVQYNLQTGMVKILGCNRIVSKIALLD